MEKIDYERIDEIEAKREYEDLFNTFKIELKLSDEDATTAVSIATGVCHYCWEEPRGCQCWNDE